MENEEKGKGEIMKPFKGTYYKENPNGTKEALPTKNWYFQIRGN